MRPRVLVVGDSRVVRPRVHQQMEAVVGAQAQRRNDHVRRARAGNPYRIGKRIDPGYAMAGIRQDFDDHGGGASVGLNDQDSV